MLRNFSLTLLFALAFNFYLASANPVPKCPGDDDDKSQSREIKSRQYGGIIFKKEDEPKVQSRQYAHGGMIYKKQKESKVQSRQYGGIIYKKQKEPKVQSRQYGGIIFKNKKKSFRNVTHVRTNFSMVSKKNENF